MSVFLNKEDKIQIKLYYYFLRADGKISDAEREWFERIANENGIPYIAATESRSILAGGTPKELLSLSVYQEVQIAKEIKLPIEDMIRNVTRGIEIAYRTFEELGRRNEAE